MNDLNQERCHGSQSFARVNDGWLGSRVVSMLDSGAEGPGFKSQSRGCLRQIVHTHRASVHQAAKLVAARLRVARLTAGLAESNGSLPPGLWLTLLAGWLPRTGISSGTLRSVIDSMGYLYLFKRTGVSGRRQLVARPGGPMLGSAMHLVLLWCVEWYWHFSANDFQHCLISSSSLHERNI